MMISAAEKNLVRCHYCGLLSDHTQHTCRRCNGRLHQRNQHSLQRSWALLISAVIMYLPANLFPIMITQTLGQEERNTIISGVILFLEHGDYFIALVIFSASVLVPLLKILLLGLLCWRIQSKTVSNQKQLQKIYNFAEFVGRWSMIDVFVVAVLVGIIQFGTFMSIFPGPAILAFAAVVILTMLAAETFDSRMIWDLENQKKQVKSNKS